MRNKERKKEYNKKWYQENRERSIRRQKDYYQRTRECRLETQKKYYQNNREKSIKYATQWKKDNKELKKEYDKKWYQKNKERSAKQTLEWRKNNKERYEEATKKRLNTERGFFSRMWNDVKQKGESSSFKNFDDFYNHWLEQKKIHGMKCPATGVEMTTKLLFNEKGKKFQRCGTNISKDRILSSIGYSHQNLIFTCWNYNRAKGSFTPKMAKAFLKIVKERYGTDDLE